MGIFSSIASLFGYNPEADALNSAKNTISQGYDNASAAYQPYVTAGQNALSQYLNATGQGNSTQGLTDFQNSPIYSILSNTLKLGDTGVLANSAGSLNSGNTIRAVQDYNRQQANNAFGEYLNPIASTASQGYGATGAQAQLGVDKAGSLANIQNQQGQVAGANSIWGGLDSAVSGAAQLGGIALGGGFGTGAQNALTGFLGLGGGGQSSYGPISSAMGSALSGAGGAGFRSAYGLY